MVVRRMNQKKVIEKRWLMQGTRESLLGLLSLLEKWWKATNDQGAQGVLWPDKKMTERMDRRMRVRADRKDKHKDGKSEREQENLFNPNDQEIT